MCKHYWLIDAQNFGVCKLCPKTKDFQPANDKFFGSNKLRPEEAKLLGNLHPLSAGYPVQGTIRYPFKCRTMDYCFSVDDIE